MQIKVEKVSKFDQKENFDKEFRIQFLDIDECATFLLTNNSPCGAVASITIDKKHIRELKDKINNILQVK
jgi:hypothetical protein